MYTHVYMNIFKYIDIFLYLYSYKYMFYIHGRGRQRLNRHHGMIRHRLQQPG